jgi:chorismate mutase/prephenate dehydratase
MKLEENRKLMDGIDAQIVDLLNRRCLIAQRIGRIKAAAGLPIVDHERERVVMRRIASENAGPIDNWVLVRIYTELLAESRRIQQAVTTDVIASGEAVQ